VRPSSGAASTQQAGAGYALKHTVPKVICKTDGIGRGFITDILAPVNCRREPRFGVRQTMWVMTLAFGTVALMRLLLAQ
jgi:hypothetical protein